MRNVYKKGTRRHAITEQLLSNGMDRQVTYATLSPKVAVEKPFFFKDRSKGSWLPRQESLTRLDYEIGAVIVELRRQDGDGVPEPTPQPAEKKKNVKPEDWYLSEVRRLRAFAKARDDFDHISIRPVQEGGKGLKAGLPPEALLSSMTLHWSIDSKRQGEVAEYDFLNYAEADKGKHPAFPYMLKLAEARIPTMLIGPAGTGKSHAAKQVAESLDLAYGECPMTAGATPSWLLGRQTLKGYVPAEFVTIYGNGGVFNFEEIDSADPNMLLVVNNALATGELHNPVSGETITRHENFVPISTANTFGEGGTRAYTGRERLDAATIDRWRMGRVFIPLSESVEDFVYSAALGK